VYDKMCERAKNTDVEYYKYIKVDSQEEVKYD